MFKNFVSLTASVKNTKRHSTRDTSSLFAIPEFNSITVTMLCILVFAFFYSLNRAAQHELEKDGGDKLAALNLDSTCHQMRNSSRGVQYYDGIHRVDNT